MLGWAVYDLLTGLVDVVAELVSGFVLPGSVGKRDYDFLVSALLG